MSSSTAPFEFLSAGRVVFGRGVFAQTAALALGLGRQALVVTGSSALGEHVEPGPGLEGQARPTASRLVRVHRPSVPPDVEEIPGRGGRGGAFGRLATCLEEAGIGLVHFLVRGEPTTAVADDGARFAIASGCEMVIGLGGGSVLDAAKAISGLMTNGGNALDYLEVVGGGRSLESPAASLIAIPTTSGTGSEVTKNAVLTEPKARIKASIRSPLLLPAIALIDPDLTHSLPPSLTASTGLDALTQLIEAYLTPRANPITDLFALDGIERSARSLLRALEDGSDADAREDLALASLFGGLALANAGLGAVHGIAAPLGGRHPVPQGVACAVLLPHVFDANLRALRRADPSSPALARMARIGEVFMESFRAPGGSLPDEPGDDDPAECAARRLHFIVSRCRLPALASYGVTRSDISALVEGALRASSMKGNPIRLTSDEIASAIAAAL